MHLHLVLCLSVCGLCSAFFLFHEKGKPLLFCFKICPLYCPKHASKRYDQDASYLTYLDENPYTAVGSSKYDSSPPAWRLKTPKPTKATTTQKSVYLDYNPYLIDDGSGDYDHPPPSYLEHWKPKPTQKPTTTAVPDTTTELIYLDHNPYQTEDGPEDYVYHYPYHYEHWKPKPTKTTTTTKAPTTTTEKPIYFDHPYIIEEWPEYEYDHPIRYHSWKPTTTTTTEAPTTKEPTFICQVCAAKCEYKSGK